MAKGCTIPQTVFNEPNMVYDKKNAQFPKQKRRQSTANTKISILQRDLARHRLHKVGTHFNIKHVTVISPIILIWLFLTIQLSHKHTHNYIRVVKLYALLECWFVKGEGKKFKWKKLFFFLLFGRPAVLAK